MVLGMEYTGIVEKGSGVGTKNGFPTANISLTDPNLSGIYAAMVRVGTEQHVAAVYADQYRELLEAHLLDWGGDLYGKEITITIGKKIREAERFPDDKALLAAIAHDIALVRKCYS